jgi:hypothetical protein
MPRSRAAGDVDAVVADAEHRDDLERRHPCDQLAA